MKKLLFLSVLLLSNGALWANNNKEAIIALSANPEKADEVMEFINTMPDKEKELLNDEKFLPIHLAAQYNNIPLLKKLLAKNNNYFHVNALNNYKSTPLILACANNQKEAAQILLNNNADATIASEGWTQLNGWTPLMAAAANGHDNIINILLDSSQKDTILNAKDTNTGATALYIACQHGHAASAQALLKYGADATIPTKLGSLPLTIAAVNGHDNIINILLNSSQKDTILNAKRSLTGATALNIACQRGHATSAQALLNHGADATIPDSNGFTPLMVAAEKDNIINILLDSSQKDTILNAKNTKTGATALYIACYDGHATSVQALLNHGADATIPDSNNGWAPLIVATVNGYDNIINILLNSSQKDTILNARNQSGETALYTACKLGHKEAARLLLEHRADATIPDYNNLTPLMIAIEKKHTDIISLLLKSDQKDVIINTKYSDTITLKHSNATIYVHAIATNTTPLHLACKLDYKEAVSLLLEHGADATIPLKDGYTPLMTAALKGYANIISLLLNSNQKEAIINTTNQSGETALHLACRLDYKESVSLLLEHGADATMPLKNGYTPLMIAALKGHANIISLLLNSNQKDTILNATVPENNVTALHIACSEGHENATRALLEHGADATMPLKNGYTPLMIAALKGHANIISLLLNSNQKDTILNATVPENNVTALYIACNKGHENAARALLDHGADDATGFSLLKAIENKNRKMTLMLLNYGINKDGSVNLTDKISSIYSKPEITKAKNGFFGKEAPKTYKGFDNKVKQCILNNSHIFLYLRDDNTGETILHKAVANGWHDTALRILQYAPGLLSYKNKKGLTPLQATDTTIHASFIARLLEMQESARLKRTSTDFDSNNNNVEERNHKKQKVAADDNITIADNPLKRKDSPSIDDNNNDQVSQKKQKLVQCNNNNCKIKNCPGCSAKPKND